MRNPRVPKAALFVVVILLAAASGCLFEPPIPPADQELSPSAPPPADAEGICRFAIDCEPGEFCAKADDAATDDVGECVFSHCIDDEDCDAGRCMTASGLCVSDDKYACAHDENYCDDDEHCLFLEVGPQCVSVDDQRAKTRSCAIFPSTITALSGQQFAAGVQFLDEDDQLVDVFSPIWQVIADDDEPEFLRLADGSFKMTCSSAQCSGYLAAGDGQTSCAVPYTIFNPDVAVPDRLFITDVEGEPIADGSATVRYVSGEEQELEISDGQIVVDDGDEVTAVVVDADGFRRTSYHDADLAGQTVAIHRVSSSQAAIRRVDDVPYTPLGVSNINITEIGLSNPLPIYHTTKGGPFGPLVWVGWPDGDDVPGVEDAIPVPLSCQLEFLDAQFKQSAVTTPTLPGRRLVYKQQFAADWSLFGDLGNWYAAALMGGTTALQGIGRFVDVEDVDQPSPQQIYDEAAWQGVPSLAVDDLPAVDVQVTRNVSITTDNRIVPAAALDADDPVEQWIIVHFVVVPGAGRIPLGATAINIVESGFSLSGPTVPELVKNGVGQLRVPALSGGVGEYAQETHFVGVTHDGQVALGFVLHGEPHDALALDEQTTVTLAPHGVSVDDGVLSIAAQTSGMQLFVEIDGADGDQHDMWWTRDEAGEIDLNALVDQPEAATIHVTQLRADEKPAALGPRFRFSSWWRQRLQ